MEWLGYNVNEPKLLNASDYGVPQRRVRAIFIASRIDVVKANYPTPTTPEIKDKITVLDAIGDLSSEEGYSSPYALSLKEGRTPHFKTGKPISNYGSYLNNEISKHNEAVTERFSIFLQGESVRNIVTRIIDEGLDLSAYSNLLLECVFNANKEYNIQKFKSILENVKPEFYFEKAEKEKKINSLFYKITKMWSINLENNDKELIKVAKNFNLSLDEFKSIFIKCKNELNKKYTPEFILSLFKDNPEVVNDKVLMESLLTRKNTRSRLNSSGVAPTMLTLPDDFIHPYLNRILSVREMARIQSFDDSFEFKGKRTTGGDKRKDEVPQYTQVGNAVPPLLAFAIANEIKVAINLSKELNQNSEKQLIM